MATTTYQPVSGTIVVSLTEAENAVLRKRIDLADMFNDSFLGALRQYVESRVKVAREMAVMKEADYLASIVLSLPEAKKAEVIAFIEKA